MTAAPPAEKYHVRVWFGSVVIARQTAPKDRADRYAASMARRFPSLRVTNRPVRAAVSRER